MEDVVRGSYTTLGARNIYYCYVKPLVGNARKEKNVAIFSIESITYIPKRR